MNLKFMLKVTLLFRRPFNSKNRFSCKLDSDLNPTRNPIILQVLTDLLDVLSSKRHILLQSPNVFIRLCRKRKLCMVFYTLNSETNARFRVCRLSIVTRLSCSNYRSICLGLIQLSNCYSIKSFLVVSTKNQDHKKYSNV